MASRSREAAAPLYLFLCLIVGGSAQGIWANMLLQLLGIGLIGWAAAARNGEPPAPAARRLFILILLGLVLIALELIPLPPAIWSSLGGRGELASGYALLGMPVPALPLSLTPHETLSSLLALIPALAMVCALIRLRAFRPSWLAAALVAGALCGILLGTLQVASSEPLNSPWYLYPDTSFGFAVGFFANANHMATLLVITLPFLAALLAAARGRNLQRYSALLAIVAGIALVIAVGIVLNRSLAGYLLALPVIAASALILMPARSRLRQWALLVAGLCLVGGLGALESTSIRSGTIGAEATTSVESREMILATTLAAARDFLPLGSGVGSFRQVYQLYEDPGRVDSTYVVHAHNDYAELMLETGIPGTVLLVLFLGWWAAAAWRVWRSAEAGPYARAASIASAAILAHSLVDFPLRTAAIGTCFAMCLALLADKRAVQASEKGDLRPTRHVVIE
jgi:O-antigen ligase